MPERVEKTGTVTFCDDVAVRVKLTIDIIGENPIIIGKIVLAEPDDVLPHKIGECMINLSNLEIYTKPKAATFAPDNPSP